MKDTFDFEKEFQETPKKKSYADLDLGLDFDLSFLDDVDESVLDEEPVKEAPEKKTSEKKAPAAQKDTPKKAAPVKKAAGDSAEAPVKKASAKKQASAENAEAPVKKASPKKQVSAENAEAPVKKAPAKKAASAENAADPAVKKAAPKKAAPKTDADADPSAAPAKKASAKKQAAPQEAPAKSKKKKKGPRLGGVIFYTLYFMFILVFFVAAYFGLQWLQGWLTDYEAAQPTVKAEQVFQEVFTSPDWGALYDSAGAQDSAYEGKEEYVAYMKEKVGGTALTYMETSAGLSGNKKYIVRLGDEKVASFTLVDKNKTSAPSLENLENITEIPDWQLGAVEVFFEREESYYIEKLDGYTAYVNDVALDDSFVIQKATTVAENYLPEGTTGLSMDTLQISGLMELPTVTVFDRDNKQVEVTYDETTRTFTARTESNTMSEDQKEIALEAAKTYCLWMIEEITNRGTVAKYFDPSSDAYNTIIKSTELWMQNFSSYEFTNTSVTDYARYSDDIFSVRVKLSLDVTRTNGTVKEHPYDQSMFFQKNDSGNWLCFVSTNIDVSEPVGKVRLTFKQGDTQLTTGFVDTDAKEVVTPKISVPEGQVFTGWVTVSEDETGATVYNLEFQPDDTGIVTIPDGTTLKPMTLYALVQDAGEVQEITEVPAETTAETTPAETTEGA